MREHAVQVQKQPPFLLLLLFTAAFCICSMSPAPFHSLCPLPTLLVLLVCTYCLGTAVVQVLLATPAQGLRYAFPHSGLEILIESVGQGQIPPPEGAKLMVQLLQACSVRWCGRGGGVKPSQSYC